MIALDLPISPSLVSRRRLQPGALFSATVRAGERLEMEDGIAWVTLANDADDHVLAGGEAMTFAAGGKIVVQALRGPAKFRLVR